MILNFILFLFTEVINAAVSVLPTATLPSWFEQGVSSLSNYFISWNFIIPISSFLLLIAYFVTLEAAILVIFGVNAIIKVVRGSG